MSLTVEQSRRETVSGVLDARPLVAARSAPGFPWLFVTLITGFAILLFVLLESRRNAAQVRTAPTTAMAAEQVPELVLPSASLPATPATPITVEPVPRTIAQPSPLPARPFPVTPPVRYPATAVSTTPPLPPLGSAPMLVSGSGTAPSSLGSLSATGADAHEASAKATHLANPATTVVLGTMIPAILETALDTSAPGQVRALVNRDVHGYDGSRLLIPRGSRLYGTYQNGLSEGEKRVQVRWTRLMRPDGVMIGLDSAAADPMGRGGIGGSVNNHILTRLTNALLSSAVSIGTVLATRGSSPVLVALPSATQNSQQIAIPGQIRPTIKVKAGTRVAVFVERDLDFLPVEEGP